jgi:transposase
MNSTKGRPRTLSDAQISIILAWDDELQALRKLRRTIKTLRQLAKEIGAPMATISEVIRRRGVYKQVSPEKREEEIEKRHRRMARLREREVG